MKRFVFFHRRTAMRVTIEMVRSVFANVLFLTQAGVAGIDNLNPSHPFEFLMESDCHSRRNYIDSHAAQWEA